MFTAVLVLMIIIAALISYFTIKDRLYDIGIVTRSSAVERDSGAQELISRAEVKRLNGILLAIPAENYSLSAKAFSKEASDIREYTTVLRAITDVKTAIRPVNGGFVLKAQEIEEAAEAYAINLHCCNVLEYALRAQRYAEEVRNRAEKLMKFKIFDESTQKRIAATGAVYFDNNGKQPLAYVCAGVDMLLRNLYADIFAVLAAIICGIIAFLPLKNK